MIYSYEIFDFLLTKMNCSFRGNQDLIIEEIVPFNAKHKKNGSLFWINLKNVESIKEVSAGIVICPFEATNFELSQNASYIFCENPRRAFSLIVSSFFDQQKIDSSLYVIHESCIISKSSIIEDGVTIGKNCVIGHNTVIHSNVKIGNNVKIGANNTIGGVGFGYEKNEDGDYELIPHIGNVVIEDNVEIGNNVCIDRAVLGSTVIGKNCKIDNLVHIAHGVEIGENSLIIANSMIAGSTRIGSNTWIAPSTSIINGTNIGSNSMSGMGSVIINEVPNNSLVVGIPAKKIKDI